MPVGTPSVVRWVSAVQAGNIANANVSISGLAVGEGMIVAIHFASSLTITTPSGWTSIVPKTTIGSRAFQVFRKVKASSGETSVAFALSGTAGVSYAVLGVVGSDPSDWIIGTAWTRGGGHGTSTTTIIDGVVTTTADSVALALAFEASNAMESPNTIVSVNNGFAELGYLGQIAVNDRIETIWAGTKAKATAGDVGDTTVTTQQVQASNGGGVMIGIPAGPYLPIGTPMEKGNGEIVYMSYLDGSGVRKAFKSVNLWLPGFNDVDALLAKPGATIAHRGGSAVYPQMSEYAYDHSVFNGFGALEFSCGWTSDLVPFGLGFQYLDDTGSVAPGTNLDPTTLSWATLSSTYFNKLLPVSSGVWQPFYRLEEFLEKFTKTHVVTVDPKYGFANQTKINVMLDICDEFGGPDKIIIKFDSSETDAKLTTSASARGYERMNYWNADTTAMAAQQSRWTILGANYATQAAIEAANSYGKPVWAAIIPNQAGYDQAIAWGADYGMITNPITIAPVSV